MEEHLLTLTLTRIRGLSQPMALVLYKEFGSAKAVFDLLHQKENLPPLLSPKLLSILRNGYDEAFGARPLKRLITSAVEDKIADLILTGSIGEGSTVYIDVKGKDLTVG
jgi:ATP-dependent Clp protease ATP-binding subunit ClpA